MIVQLLSRYLCIDNTNQQNTTINVYTLFVASTYVITFLCYISNKFNLSKIVYIMI